MNLFTTGALALTIALGASGVARAAFPSCDPSVDNPRLEPLSNGTYPSDPAIPYTGSHHTKWAVDGLEIKLAIDDAAATNFYIDGVNYEPTQIGGSADFSPFNDFFYSNSVSTWTPLWSRDIPALRAMGVNSLRNYGMWKWEPGFAQEAPNAPDGVATFWKLLNFSALKSSENDNQFCYPGSNQQIYAFQHPTHADFLDLLWNNGDHPIYTWIGVSLPLPLVDPNVPEERKAAFRQFYRYTAKWLAKKYGDHPAVIGFVVGNELDTPGTTPTSEFWETLNDFGAVIKASAPNKLTAFTFHDTDDYNRRITSGRFANERGPNVYGLDVYGFNPYTNPLPEGNLFSRFRDNVVLNCTQPNNNNLPCVRPLMFGEFGTPADAHAVTAKTYPVQWVEQNFIWNSSPPPAMCLTRAKLGPPPGSGGDGPRREAERGTTIAVELAPASITMPANLAPFFPSSSTGEALPAAAQAEWITSFLRVSKAHQASNSSPASDLDFNSGGYAFEWRDEWWKANPVPYFHSITGTDTCTSCTSGAPEPPGCDTGAANVAFSGGWGDEEWFGLAGAKANNRKNSDPVIVKSTGKLNGGPDILAPRAAVVALCQAFGNCP
jgi:hypothetical protein